MIKRLGRTAGFTLIEMGIVLVVIGLIISGGLTAVSPVLRNSKIAETNQRLDLIEQALVLHVIRYGCLPCPANPADGPAAATLGQANAGGAYTGCTGTACTNVIGVVPWVALNLSETNITDGFGTRIAYAISTTGNLQTSGNMNRTPPSTYPQGNLQVNNTSGTEVTGGAGNRAAYVLISRGPDKAYGYRGQSGTGPAADQYASTPQAENNSTGNQIFVQDDEVYIKDATYFDDIVRWRTPAVIDQLCGANACGNPA